MSLGQPDPIGNTDEPFQIAGLLFIKNHQHVDVGLRGPITAGSRSVEPNAVYSISEMLAYPLSIDPEQATHILQPCGTRLCLIARFHAVSLLFGTPPGQGERR